MSAYRTMVPVSADPMSWLDEFAQALIKEYGPQRPDYNRHQDRACLAYDLDRLLRRHPPTCGRCHKPVAAAGLVRSAWTRELLVRVSCHGTNHERALDERAIANAMAAGHRALVELVWTRYFND